MKNLLITAILAALCSPAAAMEELPSSFDTVASYQVASANLNRPGRTPVGRARSSSLAPTDERSLSRALELPVSDLSIPDEALDSFAELELRMPEYNLPESDIPLTVNSKVAYFLNYFQTTGKPWFGKWLSRSERYIPMMKEVLKREGLPEDLVYLAMIESGFSPHAYSHASAVGPWQFIAGTGKRYSLRIDQWIDERRDPLKSTIAAAMYLKELYGLFNKDWYLAAAGYNAGENKILRAIDMYESRDFWQLSQGSYLKRETKDYVPKLLAAAIIAKEPAKYGFADVAYLPPIEFDTVSIPTRTDLELVARVLGVSTGTIRELNPELRQWCTPPDYPGYLLKIPKGTKERFLSEYAKVPAEQRFTEKIEHIKYRAGKDDTLESIARRFGARSEELAAINGIKSSRKLRGKVLRVPVKAGEAQPVVALQSAPPQPAVVSAKKVDDSDLIKYYTVKRGDTLTSLARRFNVSAKIIAAWNNMKIKASLQPGKRIIVARYSEKKDRAGARPDENG
jgi:membrane-bound lytic murein transglycosylase D